MKTKNKIPARVKRRDQNQKIKSFNAPIIGDSRAKSQVSATKNIRPSNLISKGQEGRAKYKRIVDIFKYGGGHNEADIYLIHWGVLPMYKGLLLAYAEYDAVSGGVAWVVNFYTLVSVPYVATKEANTPVENPL